MKIKNVRPKTKKPYYCLYEGDKFIRSIGNFKAYTKYLSDLEKLARKKQELTQGINTPNMPTTLFNVLYADPPWQYDFSQTDSRAIENQYPTMTIKQIVRLKSKLPIAENAVLFLWATAPKLREALEVMESWGFSYCTNAVWDKEKIGMGYWFRGQHELLLVGVKGEFSPPQVEARYSSVIRETRTNHSKKPERVYTMIEAMFPNGKYLELFARSKHGDNWEAWGNEAGG